MVVLLVIGLVVAGCAGDEAGVDDGLSEALPPTTVESTTTTNGLDAPEASEVAEPLVVAPESTVASIETTTSAAQPTTAAEPATSSSATTTSTTATTSPPTTSGTVPPGWGTAETVRLRFESQVSDVPVEEFAAEAMAILTDDRGWGQAGFTFVADPDATFRVVLAEGAAVDQLCLPLRTFSKVSCQNGPVVALNADRWRTAVGHWELDVSVYRGYLVNHEVGHLLGMRHPKPRCPVAGQPAGVMEQQTAGLEGCLGNPWPRDWEIFYAGIRPVVYAPLPDWGPDPVPENREGQ